MFKDFCKGAFIIKTLVELFDGCQIENVIGGLRFKPEKIIFIGFKCIISDERKLAISNFFSSKQINVEIDYEIVGRYDFQSIVERLNTIVDNNDDCYFDISGGKDIVLAAMGAVSALRKVPMFQINVNTGELNRLQNCDALPNPEKSVMTIAEALAVNGSGIIYNAPDDFKWDMNDEFKNDIEAMWDICKDNCVKWNWQSLIFKSFEQYGKIDENFRVTVDTEKMKSEHHESYIDGRILYALRSKGLICEYSKTDGVVSFKYKNSQVHQCISKAGNILELYAYMLLNEIAAENPGYYDDIDIGVHIDWDGVVHEPDSDKRDTKNEVDIMLTRDLVPVFISCKNGEIPKEALYELDTVADKLGGRYARKIMLATYVNQNPDTRKYTIQRAEDMKITLIYDLHKEDKNGLKKLLKNKIK